MHELTLNFTMSGSNIDSDFSNRTGYSSTDSEGDIEQRFYRHLVRDNYQLRKQNFILTQQLRMQTHQQQQLQSSLNKLLKQQARMLRRSMKCKTLAKDLKRVATFNNKR